MIYYLAQYTGEVNERNLEFWPAGVAKMNYIIDVIRAAGCGLTVLSTCRTKKGSYKSKAEKIKDDVRIWYRPTFETHNIYSFYIERYFGVLNIIRYFIKNVKKEDTVFVYHEVYYLPWVRFLKRIIGFQLVYEVEELYGMYTNNEKLCNREIKYLKDADAYIFTTNKLNEVVNNKDKTSVIIHGAYIVETDLNAAYKSKNDKIQCIYSGTFSEEKGGVYIAIAAAEKLDSRFCVHITGFGKDREIENVKKTIGIAQKKTECSIVYDGFLDDGQYRELLTKCDIGLATQNADANLNSYCFQSKAIKYLSYGLSVVTADMEVMRTSDISGALYFYNSNDKSDVAETIERAAIAHNKEENKRIIADIHSKTEHQIKNLIENRGYNS